MPYKDPAAKLANDRDYRAKNPERVRKSQAAYRAKHHEKVLVANRLYHASHAEQESSYGRAYRLNHPEKERERGRNYRLRHPEKAKARKQRYRAKPSTKTKESQNKVARRLVEKTSINNLTHAQWVAIQEAQDHRCAYCGKRFKWRLTRDHITAVKKGGPHTLHNVVGACQSCNSKKHTGPPLKPVQPLLL